MTLHVYNHQKLIYVIICAGHDESVLHPQYSDYIPIRASADTCHCQDTAEGMIFALADICRSVTMARHGPRVSLQALNVVHAVIPSYDQAPLMTLLLLLHRQTGW